MASSVRRRDQELGFSSALDLLCSFMHFLFFHAFLVLHVQQWNIELVGSEGGVCASGNTVYFYCSSQKRVKEREITL